MGKEVLQWVNKANGSEIFLGAMDVMVNAATGLLRSSLRGNRGKIGPPKKDLFTESLGSEYSPRSESNQLVELLLVSAGSLAQNSQA